MKERPIIMSAPMVRALLEERKTQTRRVLNPQPSHDQYHVWRGRVTRDEEHRMWCWKDLALENIWDFPNGEDRKELALHCPYGVPGDRLWVREAFLIDDRTLITGPLPRVEPNLDWQDCTYYRADGECCEQIPECACAEYDGKTPWRPSIFMPRWVSRITLEITDVRVQRLQEISEEDAIAEGYEVAFGPGMFSRAFDSFWDSINAKKHPWASNPWVWAITFRGVDS